MKQGKKNIALTVFTIVIITILIAAVLIVPSLLNKYGAYKLINNTLKSENICTRAHIQVDSESESFIFDVDANMSKINDKCLFEVGNSDYDLYYYDNKVIFPNLRALSFDFVKKDIKFDLMDLYFLFDVKGSQGIYEVSVDTSRLNSYLNDKVEFKDVNFKIIYDGEKIKDFIVYLSGSYDSRSYQINMTLGIKESKDFVPENLKNMILNNKFDIIGTFNNDTVKLINSFIRLIQRDFMVYDVNIGASVEILNIHKKMTFYQSSEGSIYESGNFKLYFVDGKTINTDGDIIAYSSEPFKIDAAFGVIYNILINGNFEADGDIYTFTIDERGISDLVSIFLEDVNLDLLGINRGQMHIILEDDSIDRIEFDLDGKILKVIDANVSIDVDIDYNRKFKFPENIKKSLSLDKE